MSGSVMRASTTFEKWFPTPHLLYPPSIGVDISDSSVKWLGLVSAEEGCRVNTFGSVPLTPGIVMSGMIRHSEHLSSILREMKEKFGGVLCAHAALPEEAAYVFGMHVPVDSSREQILRLIEFEFEGRVPIPPAAAIYDFDVISNHDGAEGSEIGVVVFPRDIAESYVEAFEVAGIELLSLEIEARSVSRAVSSGDSDATTLLVDFGIARTGFALLKRGIPIFTSTVDVGGDAITNAVMEKLSLSPEEAQVFKNNEGLFTKRANASSAVEAMTTTATALSNEIAKHFHYWDTRRDSRGERVTPVSRVLLVGGSSNLKGLPEFVAAKVQAPAERGNIWNNICTFDAYIPPIDYRTSLQYATAAGLALRGI